MSTGYSNSNVTRIDNDDDMYGGKPCPPGSSALDRDGRFVRVLTVKHSLITVVEKEEKEV